MANGITVVSYLFIIVVALGHVLKVTVLDFSVGCFVGKVFRNS